MICFVSFRTSESSRYSSVPVSEPCPETTSKQDTEDNREHLAPLNLSTRNPDKEKSPSDHRLRCLDAEKIKQEEFPLNLSLRASYSSPVHLSPSLSAEMDEEPCDQRQTAALALCQLAIASSVASSCDFSTTDRPSEDSTEDRISGCPKKTEHTTKAKATSTKRANSGQPENNFHKPNKRAKTPGRALRRRPRCC